MKKIKSYIVPAIAILIFIAIMTTGGVLKKPFGKRDDVNKYIVTLKKDVMKEEWDKADRDLKQLEAAWRIVEKRVQFSVDRDEMLAIDTSIARIEGAVLVHDKNLAITEISEAEEHWEDLEK